MSKPSTFQIKVPGSTANLGPGFDSIGMAVNRYLLLEADKSENWSFHYLDQPKFRPALESNLIYVTAKKIADEYGRTLPAYSVNVRNEIPLSRGLGSSGSAIIAGIELADFLLDLKLSIDEKLWIACRAEGHPDNVSASLYGGLVISSQSQTKVTSMCLPAPDYDFVTVIPNFELKTSDARKALPRSLSFKQAVEASSVGNVLVAALLSGDGKKAGQMMESDKFHQPYRANLIPCMDKIVRLAHANGAYGTFLSGAGPTVMSLTERSMSSTLCNLLRDAFADYECTVLRPVNDGVRITIPAEK
ncbi:homoserine kinase [Sporolactobacillus inulinus]|uniref:Homoserine kinase n=1 Tax=Sporolactobacillus inulinus CASD TaxID=1069536 RepID=A0A0U1QR01_9BACL|nr:homoserine kinase [Sporolactobacillus inulinus]KLI03265.1 serine kinase [Sporolactobacillus inulinus CASD]GEB76798.1 homoserine kinase [Sporolactobacillus inulinus]